MENTDKKIITNPVKVIRAKCIDCMCGQVEEVKRCPCEDCPLWPFRMGKNPYRTKSTREFTPEQREAARERMRKLHEARKHD